MKFMLEEGVKGEGKGGRGAKGGGRRAEESRGCGRRRRKRERATIRGTSD